MKRIRLSPKFRAEWAHLEACLAAETAERVTASRKGEESIQAGRARAQYRVATVVCERWERAGYTSVRLEDGLPRPERPHMANWTPSGQAWVCSVCAARSWRLQGPTCRGPSPMPLVLDALDRCVPFGLRDGLPTAGVPLVPGDVVRKLARVTCTPMPQGRAA